MTCRNPRAPGGRGRRPLGPVALLAATVVLSGACGDGPEPHAPRLLVDGSLARAASIRFEGADEPVLQTRLRLVTARSARPGSRLGDCLRGGWSTLPEGPVVHRIGVDGESATFSDRSRRELMGCDGAPGIVERRWCGHVHGRLARGRLRDPRLDLGGCKNEDGDRIAFVWITPGPRARYVVVDRDGFSESYTVAARLPIRVSATERVDSARSSAVVEASEHTADGDLLRKHEVNARVAG